MHLLGGVGPAEEEDLSCELLAALLAQICAAVAAVEAAAARVGLLEAGVLAAGQREVAHHVQAVPAAGGPAADKADHHLRHEPDQPLHLQDVQPPGARRIHRVGGLACRVLVAGAAADALVAAGAERPAAVAWARPVAGEQHHADVGRHPRVVERAVQLVDGVRAERVAHLGAVERDPDRAVVDVAVIRDVGEVAEAVDGSPERWVKRLLAQGCWTPSWVIVRSPQLIVCASVTAGSCADAAAMVSVRPGVAVAPAKSISVRRTVQPVGPSVACSPARCGPAPRSMHPTPVPLPRRFCRSNRNGAPCGSITVVMSHPLTRYTCAPLPLLTINCRIAFCSASTSSACSGSGPALSTCTTPVPAGGVIPTDPVWLTHSMSPRSICLLAASSGGLVALQVVADAGGAVTVAVTAGAKATASAMPRRRCFVDIPGTLQVRGPRLAPFAAARLARGRCRSTPRPPQIRGRLRRGVRAGPAARREHLATGRSCRVRSGCR